MKKNKEIIYTGIGSRETPDIICDLIKNISAYLYKNKCKLRSGGSDGADMAFEWSVRDIDLKEIYLPWKGFNGNHSPLYNVSSNAMEIAKNFYQYSWDKAKETTKYLLGRNVYQVLGRIFNRPSNFIICFTVDGCFSGGTGFTLKVAKHYGIPIFNLYYPNIRKNIFDIINDQIKEI